MKMRKTKYCHTTSTSVYTHCVHTLSQKYSESRIASGPENLYLYRCICSNCDRLRTIHIYKYVCIPIAPTYTVTHVFPVGQALGLDETKEYISVIEGTLDSTPLRLPNICPPNLSPQLLCQTFRQLEYTAERAGRGCVEKYVLFWNQE